MDKTTHQGWTDYILAHKGRTVIYLSKKGLTTLPPELWQLTQLEYLYFYDNQLTALPPELGRLTQLQRLDVYGNQLTALPPELWQLTQLEYLDISRNQLTALRPELGQLTQLKKLRVSGNRLTALPPELGRLTQLIDLDVSRNQLTALPPELGRLTQLVFLDVFRNQLTTLPPELGRLTQLQRLDVSGNQLTALPPELRNLNNLKYLDIRGNPLGAHLPPEIVERPEAPQAILTYWFSLAEAEAWRPLNEAKVLVVGQSNVGKTSIITRLITGDCPETVKTEGIDIHRWQTPTPTGQIDLNIWDFGGQEIFHQTHQFFLTKRSLYLLVLNSRDDEHQNRLEYWLRLIDAQAPGAPVIVVANKCDENHLELDWQGLRANYLQIKGMVKRASCKTGEGFEELEELINREAPRLEHIGKPLPASWFTVKDRLGGLSQEKIDYLSYNDYREMCREQGIDREDQRRTLVAYLHELGIALNFPEHPDFVLNPEWVTEGVYRILHSPLLHENQGVMLRQDLSRILPEDRYPREKHQLILDLMRRFELIFDFEDPHLEKFLAPGLLGKEQPPDTGRWEDCLYFQYRYKVLPPGIISRLMVRLHRYISSHTFWRTGVVFLYPKGGNRARVTADLQDHTIAIQINGIRNSQREFLAIIRHELEEINRRYQGLPIELKIPLEDYPGKVVDYKFLLEKEKQGEPYFQPETIVPLVTIEVIKLLDRITSERGRDMDREKLIVIQGDNYGQIGGEKHIGQEITAGKITGGRFIQAKDYKEGDIDLARLAGMIEEIKELVKGKASDAEDFLALADLDLAGKAAGEGNGVAALGYLKKAGKWTCNRLKELGKHAVYGEILSLLGKYAGLLPSFL